MTAAARSPRAGGYRPQPDVALAMRAPWDPSEKQFQALVLDVAGRLGWSAYHTHDSRRSQPGFPDLVLARPPRLLFAELKRPGGKPTDEQRRWLELLNECAGVDAYLITSTGDRVRDAQAIAELLNAPRGKSDR